MFCVMYQSITSRFIVRRISHAKQICLWIKMQRKFLMNTEFHATVRAVITIEMSDTRKLSRQPMDQTRC